MNIFKRFSCFFNKSNCDWSLIEIFPVDLNFNQTKRLFRCSKCRRVRYKINVRG